MKRLIILYILLMSSFLFISCSGSESIFQGSRNNGLTREEAEEVAIEYISTSYMYVAHQGENIKQIDWGGMENNNYMFIYEYDVNSEDLPDNVHKIRVMLEIIDGVAQNANIESISD